MSKWIHGVNPGSSNNGGSPPGPPEALADIDTGSLNGDMNDGCDHDEEDST